MTMHLGRIIATGVVTAVMLIGLLLFVALGWGIMVAFGWLESADPVAGFFIATGRTRV